LPRAFVCAELGSTVNPRFVSLFSAGLAARFAAVCVLGSVLLPPASAADTPAGHSMHGDAFNEGPRQAAYLMGGTGRVHLPVTTRSTEAQKFFNQGIGQLHGFWYFEAERSFRQAAALDPGCAMAYWGMAMANNNNAKRARGFIVEAIERKSSVSPREQRWIDALAAYRSDDKAPDKKRREAYLAALAALAKDFPDDLEAKAFWAHLQWESSSKGVPIKDKFTVDKTLREVLDVEPLHPVHHYRIHLWDEARATNALDSAAANGSAASACAHMWHMSGHTYSKLKRYSDAAWQQEASARTDHAYMMANRVMPDQIHNFAHNNEWLIRNFNHLGAVDRAIDLARNMAELPRHPKFNTLTKGSANYGYQRLLETLVRYELWDDLITFTRTVYLEPVDDPGHATRRARALGIAHAHRGELGAIESQLVALEALRQQALEKAKTTAKASEEKKDEASDAEYKEDEKSEEAKADDAKDESSAKPAAKPAQRRGAPASPTAAMDNALAELRGWLALKRGDLKPAREEFAKSKDLPKERLAQIEWQLGDKAKAEKTAKDAMKAAENQVQPLANYIDLAYRNGSYEDAYYHFFGLRDLCAEADLDAPILQRLASVARELKFPADWRPKLERPEDFGKRPPLDKLGPFRWQPQPALAWSLPGVDGRKVALRDYRGRPVLVIFYLGHGCAHCIQQLNAFAPVVKDFAEAGIAIVAISTDSVEGLARTFEMTEIKEKFPFPVVSDEKLKVFKEYRCYDDFEKMPLHGTFLVDGEGLVRWQDISYQPFMETKFLLGEAQRLLGQTRKPMLAGAGE
jgi:peroxiredoxin